MEGIRLDRVSRRLIRTVQRSGGRPNVTSEIGVWPSTREPRDLKAAGEWVYLRRSLPLPNSSDGAKLRVVDLFSGCGAMSLGVAEACRALDLNFAPVAAFDINPVAVRVYAQNFGLDKLTPTDLGSLLSSQLNRRPTKAEREMLVGLRRVDLVVAGPPCQGHSNLNNRTRRDDPKNELYFCLARFAKLTEPRHIIIENVPSVMADRRRVVQRTAEALTTMGYNVRSALVNIWDLGVPQTRKRHVLVASKREVPEIARMVADHLVPPRPVWWAIGDLEDIDEVSERDRPTEPKKITQRRIDYLFDRGLYDLPDRMRPDCHRFKSAYLPCGLWPDAQGSSCADYNRRIRHDGPRSLRSPDSQTDDHPTRGRAYSGPSRLLRFFPGGETAPPYGAIGNAVPPQRSYVIALELLR